MIPETESESQIHVEHETASHQDYTETETETETELKKLRKPEIIYKLKMANISFNRKDTIPTLIQLYMNHIYKD